MSQEMYELKYRNHDKSDSITFTSDKECTSDLTEFVLQFLIAVGHAPSNVYEAAAGIAEEHLEITK